MPSGNDTSWEIIPVAHSKTSVSERVVTTIIKSRTIRVLDIQLPAGEEIAEHKAPGEITVHCTTGEVEFTTMGKTKRLKAGHLLCLPASELHAVKAVENSSVLVTISMPPNE